MKFGISNIAWKEKDDNSVYDLMREYGFTGLEVAPSRLWAKPFEVGEEEVDDTRNWLLKRNISIISLQALHFGFPSLQVFGTEENRRQMLTHTKNCILLAEKLDADVLVFGSPKNRIVGTLRSADYETIAESFFGELAEFADPHHQVICVEPNPTVYGADFITRTEEAVQWVKRINKPGFKLNIDTGTLFLNNEEVIHTLETALPYAGHFHISEPMLDQIPQRDEVKHEQISAFLKKVHYNGWVSVEMRPGLGDSDIASVEKALRFVRRVYGE